MTERGAPVTADRAGARQAPGDAAECGVGARRAPTDDAERRTRARLRWRCRRGTRELDTLLVGFFDRRYRALSAADKWRFSQLLELPDPDLHDYLLGWHAADDPAMARLIERIRAL